MAVSTNQAAYQYPRLSQDQQHLLVAALSSNKRASTQARSTIPQNTYTSVTGARSPDTDAGTGMDMFDTSLYSNFDTSEFPGLNDPFLETTNFEFDPLQQTIGPPSGSAHSHSEDDGEAGEKRKSPTDDEDDDGEHKRHEYDDKTSKKPGRKPVTSEPTTVRESSTQSCYHD